MSGRRGLFRRRRVLASAGRRSHRTDGAGGLPESGAGRCHARARRAERFRGDAALAALLRSDWCRLGARARVAEGAARALAARLMTQDTLTATKTDHTLRPFESLRVVLSQVEGRRAQGRRLR